MGTHCTYHSKRPTCDRTEASQRCSKPCGLEPTEKPRRCASEQRKGQTKPSMDYMTMDSQDDEVKAPASLVIVEHQDGGILSHATACKGIQGDRHWLATRAAKDIDNCGTKGAKAKSKRTRNLKSRFCRVRSEKPAEEKQSARTVRRRIGMQWESRGRNLACESQVAHTPVSN